MLCLGPGSPSVSGLMAEMVGMAASLGAADQIRITKNWEIVQYETICSVTGFKVARDIRRICSTVRTVDAAGHATGLAATGRVLPFAPGGTGLPERPSGIDNKSSEMADHTTTTLSVRGCNITLLRGGSGPPLLFLHGSS